RRVDEPGAAVARRVRVARRTATGALATREARHRGVVLRAGGDSDAASGVDESHRESWSSRGRIARLDPRKELTTRRADRARPSPAGRPGTGSVHRQAAGRHANALVGLQSFDDQDRAGAWTAVRQQ